MTHKDLKIVSVEELSIIQGKISNLIYFLPELETKDIERELKILIGKINEL